MGKPDIVNLSGCVEDTRIAGLDADPGPEDPVNFHLLRGRLQTAKPRIAKIFIDAAFTPYTNRLDDLGEEEFTQILLSDTTKEGAAGLMIDIAQAFLQRGERYEPKSRGAFQEVVADLYDGFLGSESRGGVNPPDRETLPPMVKFGNPDFGPYTWPVDATASFDLKVGVVNLPPANARHGLLAWPALGHETAGHDILHADNGLLQEVSNAVRSALAEDPATEALASYWADRIDETASDVLGILNMGPAAGIGLIGYFRGLQAAFTGRASLRNTGPASDLHPADILRGFLAAETVRQLSFADAQDWADVLDNETDKDVGNINVAGMAVSPDAARQSARLVSRAIVTHPMLALEKHAFGEIQNWRDTDEQIVQRLRITMATSNPFPADLSSGVFAAHLVSAATISALARGANISVIFGRMVELLNGLHDRNPTFGPLRVRHRGDLFRDRAFIPLDRELEEGKPTFLYAEAEEHVDLVELDKATKRTSARAEREHKHH
ncbi:MAG: hypothetical protein ACJ746_02130 [Bryobacteraceae bacterium]